MATLSHLYHDLNKWMAEMRSDKITTRQKAFDQVENLLTTREDELVQLMNTDKYDVKWIDLFDIAHDGIEKHNSKIIDSSSASADSKNYVFISVIQKTLEHANSSTQEITYSAILEKVFSVFNNQSMIKYFGICYLQILQKFVFHAKGNLTEIRISEWSQILSFCFNFYENKKLGISNVLTCMHLAISRGLEHSQIQIDFQQYLPSLQKFINETEKGKAQNELIKISFLICSNIAVDYRDSVCEFTEEILQAVFKAYETKLDEETKTIFFKLMHLSIIIHNPEKEDDDVITNQRLLYAGDKNKWHKNLRNFHFIITSEIKAAGSNMYSVESKEPNMNESFVAFASRLCRLIYWKDEIWNEASNGEGSQSKRVKRANKLQSVIDLVDLGSNKFNWRWLAILSEMICQKSILLSVEDYQPLLQVLSNFQPTIQHSIQMKAFHKCCAVLISKENDEVFKSSTLIRKEFCKEQWTKIIENCFRCTTSNNKIATDNHTLLQLLIKNHKYPSMSFITNVLQSFYTYSTQKTNANIQTVVQILESINIESLENSAENIEKILNYIFPSSKESKSKVVMFNKEKINMKIIATISVNCVVSKSNNLTIENLPTIQCNPIDEIEKLLLLKNTESLLISKINNNIKELPKPASTYTIKEQFFELLCQSLSFDKYTLQLEDNLRKNLINILSNIELYLQILNMLLNNNAMDNETFNKCIITKKIGFKLQEIELGFAGLKDDKYTAAELNELLIKILAIFSEEYHPIINNLLRVSNFTNMFAWIFKKKFNPYNDSSQIEIVKFEAMSKDEQNRHISLSILANYMKYDGINTDVVQAFFSELNELNIYSNLDLFSIFELSKIFLKQKSTFFLSEWILNYLRDICSVHHPNVGISELIIDLFSELVQYVNEYEGLIETITVILHSFERKTIKKVYATNLAVKIMQQIKYLIKGYPHLFIEMKVIYNYLIKFLASPIFCIKLSAVENLSFIFNTKWVLGEKEISVNINQFQLDLFKQINFTVDNSLSVDEKRNFNSTHLQLLSSTICINYFLRQEAVCKFLEVCMIQKLNPEKVKSITNSISECLKINFKTLLHESFAKIINMWFTNDYLIKDFPWYLTDSESLNDFMLDHLKELTLDVLFNRIENLDAFAQLCKTTTKQLILDVLPHCLSYLIPSYAKCPSMSLKYKESTKRLHQVLLPYIQNDKLLEYMPKIIENILQNLYDVELTRSWFEVEIFVIPEEHFIEHKEFKLCLNYLKEAVVKNCPHNLITYYCINNLKEIEMLLLSFKLKIFKTDVVEQKTIHFFQYAVLIDFTTEYLNEITASKEKVSKQFLIRDFCYYFCNLIITTKSEMFRKIVCNYFNIFLEKIVFACSDYIEPYLNFIVSSLLSVYDESPKSESAKKAVNILKLFIVDSKLRMKNSIGKLNNLPSAPEFEEMQSILVECKYGEKKFTLVEEIEHVINMENVKFEGLASLKTVLSLQKDAVINLYSNLSNNRGFSEDCGTSVLHKLIIILLDQIKNQNDIKNSIEAAKCLGELGVGNLYTMALKPDSATTTYEKFSSVDEAVQQTIHVAVVELDKLLLNPNVEVVATVSSCLHHLLRDRTTQKFAENMYLQPYFSKKAKPFRIFERASVPLQLSYILENKQFGPHSIFINLLSSVLYNFLGDIHLKAVAEIELSFAETLLPLLLQVLLAHQEPTLNKEIEIFMCTFFEKFFSNNANVAVSLLPIYLNKTTIKLMLNLVECIRMNNQNFPNTKITLNYLHIAKASQHCEAYFKSILYCELWCLEEKENGSTQTVIKGNDKLINIMMDAHESIGVTDAIIAFLNPVQSRLQYYQFEKMYNRTLLHYDVSNTLNREMNSHDYVASLSNSELYYLANCMSSKNQTDYDCAWRLGDWNVVVEPTRLKKTQELYDFHSEFKKQHYKALKCVKNKDELGINDAILDGRKSIVEILKRTSFESTKNIYKYLCKLQQLQQVEDFVDVQMHRGQDSHVKMLNKWYYQDKIVYSDFKFFETIQSQRICMYKTSGVRAMRTWAPNAINDCLLNLIHESRIQGHQNVAIRNIALMNSLDLQPNSQAIVLIEDSQLHWGLGDTNLAKQIIKTVCDDKKYNDRLIKSIALRLYGEYLAESHAEEVQVLYHEIFKKSVDLIEQHLLLERNGDISVSNYINYNSKYFQDDINLKVWHSIAKYGDREYVRLTEHLKSLEIQAKRTNIEKLRNFIKANEKKSYTENEKDLQRQVIMMKKNCQIDMKELQNIEQQRIQYLKLALLFFLTYATKSTTSTSDLCLFRIISLWLENNSEPEVQELMQKSLAKIPSYKFINVLPQISARMNEGNDAFGKLIESVLVKCAKDHPHHTLNYILALANAYMDLEVDSNNVQKEPRVIGATKLLRKLRKIDELALIIDQMNQMHLELILLANNETKNLTEIPLSHNIRKLRCLDKVQCFTVDLPVSESCIYRDIIYIQKWGTKISLHGGVNAPKKIDCFCSDGTIRPQLVKGKDDMRQDAVMQQVFNILNLLLKNHKDKNHRQLTVRTYKVIPLAQRSGILEWCENTIPIGNYLLEAHPRLRPKDKTPSVCRAEYANFPGKDEVPKRHSKFLKMCEKINPVFQYFFLEHFLNPGMWFERRLAYTSSVATSSIIGYILGIGDRHVNNILVDIKTAEFIHIDFGIAFEMGKNLPTPELIPFRLTRDIVAGMGVAGVDGIFRKACEKTLEVLRQNDAVILTILEVLLYDPLYTWNVIKNTKAMKKQMEASSYDNSGVEVNLTAERALIRVQTKLSGKEDDKYLSIEGQVERLIQQATNTLNLCQHFHGMQPYL